MERSTRVDSSTPPHDLSSNLSQQAHLASAMLSGSQLGQLGQFNVPFQHPTSLCPVSCRGSYSLVSVVPCVVNPRQNRPCKMPCRTPSRSTLRSRYRSTARFSRIQVRSSRPKRSTLYLSVSLRALVCPLQMAAAIPVPVPDRKMSRQSLSRNAASCPLVHPWISHHERSRGPPSPASPRSQLVVNGRRLEGNGNTRFLDAHLPRGPHARHLPPKTTSTSVWTVLCLRPH